MSNNERPGQEHKCNQLKSPNLFVCVCVCIKSKIGPDVILNMEPLEPEGTYHSALMSGRNPSRPVTRYCSFESKHSWLLLEGRSWRGWPPRQDGTYSHMRVACYNNIMPNYEYFTLFFLPQLDLCHRPTPNTTSFADS